MTRVRTVDAHRRVALERWELALLPPGAAASPEALQAARPDWLPARVPGTAASALRAAGRWREEAPDDLDALDVWLRCRVPPASAPGVNRALRFGGLATLAEAWLDGAPLLRSESMFAAAEVDLPAGAGGDGELVLRFRALTAELGRKRPRPRWKTRLVAQQQLRWIRTSLLGRVPAWGPPAPVVGAFRPVVLEERALVGEVRAGLRALPDGDGGRVELALRWRPLPGAPAVRGGEARAGGACAPLVPGALPGGWTEARAVVALPRVERWWPATHGPQPLLPVSALLEAEDGRRVLVDLGQAGFRTLALDRDGGRFALSVNGAPVFCRGACWTPLDPLDPERPAEEVRAALAQVRAAGMNMLRLGGTFLYESDAFHDACDELGVLVWQDFQLANLDYPAGDAEWAARMRAEAEEQISRLQARPSLAVLCGGSEVAQQAAMLGLPREAWGGPLFEEMLPSACAALAPDVPYVPNSPWGGVLPFQANQGLSHYYGVGAYLRPLEDARRSEVRFTSECLGFSNVPERESLGDGALPQQPRWKAGVPRDAGVAWDFEDVRDHYLRALFGVDPAALRWQDPERYLQLSRATSGEVMEAALSEWRRGRSSCRGALVWFWRDLRAGAGWGLVDAGGRPKAPWWYLRRALQPVALAIADEGLSGLRLHAFNEGPAPLDASLELALYRGEAEVAAGARALRVPARGEVEVEGDELLGRFTDAAWAYRFGPPGHEVAVATLRGPERRVLAQAFHFPAGRPSRREELGLAGQARALADGRVEVVVRARRFAHAISVDPEPEGAAPDDRWFHLAPGAERTVLLAPGPGGPIRRVFVEACNGLAPLALAVAPAGPPR